MLTFKKLVFRFGKLIIGLLPKPIRFFFVRRLLRIPKEFKADLQIRFAQTVEDFAAADQIVREAYRERGFYTHGHQKSLNPYLFESNSYLLVATSQGEVVGTITVVGPNPKGFPLERAFQLSDRLKAMHPSAEFTSLAISRKYRRESGSNTLFLLMTMAFRLAIEHLGAKAIYATCLPRDTDFYQGILFFEPIDGTWKVSDYVGKPACCLILKTSRAFEMLPKAYEGREVNLYELFVHKKWPQLHWPREIKTSSKLLIDEKLVQTLHSKYQYAYPKDSTAF